MYSVLSLKTVPYPSTHSSPLPPTPAVLPGGGVLGGPPNWCDNSGQNYSTSTRNACLFGSIAFWILGAQLSGKSGNAVRPGGGGLKESPRIDKNASLLQLGEIGAQVHVLRVLGDKKK